MAGYEPAPEWAGRESASAEGGEMALGERFEVVIESARRGEPWALEAIYKDLSPSLVGYLRLQGAEDPDAVASEAFLGIFRSLRRFSGDEHSFRSWAFSIAHRRLRGCCAGNWRGRTPPT